MDPRYRTISFLTDYGTQDEFVGVVRSVIAAIEPRVAVLDLCHDVPRHDVRAGGLMLARAAQYLNPGVVVAVVDPGVGGDRRAIAVEVGDGVSVLVGPDNGLLAPAVAMVGGASRAIVLDATDYHLPGPSSTFDGRDVFGPVAAHLASGVRFEDLGSPIDPAGLVPGILPVSEFADGQLTAEVLWIDAFGNAQLNADPDQLASQFEERISLKVRDVHRTARVVSAFGEVTVGEIGLITDSYGLVSIVTNRTSAAEELGLVEGDEVRLSAPDDANADAGQSVPPVPVTLGRRPDGSQQPLTGDG